MHFSHIQSILFISKIYSIVAAVSDKLRYLSTTTDILSDPPSTLQEEVVKALSSNTNPSNLWIHRCWQECLFTIKFALFNSIKIGKIHTVHLGSSCTIVRQPSCPQIIAIFRHLIRQFHSCKFMLIFTMPLSRRVPIHHSNPLPLFPWLLCTRARTLLFEIKKKKELKSLFFTYNGMKLYIFKWK